MTSDSNTTYIIKSGWRELREERDGTETNFIFLKNDYSNAEPFEEEESK